MYSYLLFTTKEPRIINNFKNVHKNFFVTFCYFLSEVKVTYNYF